MSKSQKLSGPLAGGFPIHKEFGSGVKRRRRLPAATAATAAALGLAGCASMQFGHDAQGSAAAPSTQQQQAVDRVKDFTSNIDIALDQVDRERLRAAAEKKKQAMAVAPQTAVVVTTPQTTPAASVPQQVMTPTTVSPTKVTVTVTKAAPVELPVEAAPARTSQPTVTESPVTTTVQTMGVKPAPQVPAPVEQTASAAAAPVTAENISKESVAPSAEPAEPAAQTAAPTAVQTVAAPEESNPVEVITPVAVQAPAAPSAMGAMTAMVMPATIAPAITPKPVVATVSTPTAAVQAPEEPTLDGALALVRKRVAAHPTLSTALGLALLDTGDGKAADAAKGLSESDKKVFEDLLAALQTMNGPAAGATVAERATPLVNAAKKWQADADLTLPKVVLATRVDSFGVYTAVEPKFEQGKRHTVIIYCEVANFNSKKADDGWYQTNLSQQETLITDDGLLVWRPNSEEVEDRSMNQRHDFYLVKKLTIPENLAAGKYTLRMSVTDRNTNKISMVSLPVEIVSK